MEVNHERNVWGQQMGGGGACGLGTAERGTAQWACGVCTSVGNGVAGNRKLRSATRRVRAGPTTIATCLSRPGVGAKWRYYPPFVNARRLWPLFSFGYPSVGAAARAVRNCWSPSPSSQVRYNAPGLTIPTKPIYRTPFRYPNSRPESKISLNENISNRNILVGLIRFIRN